MTMKLNRQNGLKIIFKKIIKMVKEWEMVETNRL